MRKFKLIREYPNSPKIGTIAEKKDEHSCYHLSDIFHQPLNSVCIENYPEFWEEVKEEFPKIISFRRISDKMLYTLGGDDLYWEKEAIVGHTLDTMITQSENKGYTEIYQVAVSETEVFTLGDKVEIIMNRPKYSKSTIDRFELETNGRISVKVSEYCSVSLHDIKKAPEVLFVTEDGVEIFKGDKFYYISIREPNPACYSGCAQEGSAMNTNYKYFSTVEAAKKYLDENKPVYSKKQIGEALNYGTYIFVDVELFKSRLGL